MSKQHFSHITTWVFDLDHTLYPPEVRLFDQIETRMTAYVMQELGVDRQTADRLRSEYWRDYGTTLAGLMHHHEIDPEPYLVAVHDISFDALKPDPALSDAIKKLAGRRIIYTNGSAPYAEKVLDARGLLHFFDAIYGVENAGFRPKPERAAFETVFAKDGLDPARAAMFEDDPRNLKVPHEMGLKTVHVAANPESAAHIHYHTSDLARFLSALT